MANAIRYMSSPRPREDELRWRIRELEEADRKKDAFLSAVGHELRSPLGVLRMVAQILRLPQVETVARERTLDSLDRQTAHMARLVEDLLDLSRVRCGKLTLRWDVIDLRTVLATAVEMGQPLLEDRKHHLDIAPLPEPLWVSGDTTRLVQVVSNVLTNASKYSPEGAQLWLSAANEGKDVAVRIRDEGVGIPKEMLSKVFELFAQVGPAEGRSAGGLGIGLALVKHLVELHGGSVEATSAGPGKGSEFVLRLPLLRHGPDAS